MIKRNRPKYFAALPVMLLIGHLGTSPVQQRPATPKGGTVLGRIFAITKGGDIKPARMADVYLFYVSRNPNFATLDKEGKEEYEDSVGGGQYLSEEVNRLKEENEWLEANAVQVSDSLVCRHELLSYDKRNIQLLEWARARNKGWQVIIAEADEEGTIRINVPRRGMYRMVVRGRAGYNDVIWQSDVVVRPGEETSVKLSTPLHSCLAADAE
jgi:hypothetical protein